MDSKRTKTRKHLFLPGLLERVRRTFDKIEDNVRQRTAITLTDCPMSGMAMFGLKYPSLLQFEERTRNNKNSPVTHNLRTLYGIQQIPSDTYLRERLDEVNPNRNSILRTVSTNRDYLKDKCSISNDFIPYSSHQLNLLIGLAFAAMTSIKREPKKSAVHTSKYCLSSHLYYSRECNKIYRNSRGQQT
jgi:hypothetical protein